jgi:ATP-dependent Lhr-like helicase
VIIDEIHALVPPSAARIWPVARTPAGDYVAAIAANRPLSATQRPLEEVARFLAGAEAKPTPKKASGESLLRWKEEYSAP